MRNPFVRGVGGVLSADIAVPEYEREFEFYSTILASGKAPLWRDDLLNNHGAPVIGLGARTPEFEVLPLQWIPHFQVADVAASAALALGLGATELMHGKDDDGRSLWAGFVDPDGAAFGIIPVVSSDSHNRKEDVSQGCISWLSLTVPDSSSSKEFYERVIGWNARSMNPKEIDTQESHAHKFEMQIDSNTSAAEICQFASEQNETPSVWLMHLPVGDLNESLRRVKQHGGEVVVVSEYPMSNAQGKFAIVRDPVGVVLALNSCAK